MELAKSGLEHRCGMDLGWIDKSAIIDTLYDKEKKTIYVFNEFYKRYFVSYEINIINKFIYVDVTSYDKSILS
jgi:hypothetical protein